jgi:hypothetical protein
MAIVSVSRRAVATPLFVLFLIGTALAFWPFFSASRELQTFCEGLPTGASTAQVKAKAEEAGYELGWLPDGRARVRNETRYVRRECEVRFDAKGVASTRFGDLD